MINAIYILSVFLCVSIILNIKLLIERNYDTSGKVKWIGEYPNRPNMPKPKDDDEA